VTAAVEPPIATGILDGRRASPGLLLALIGQDAMRRLREAHGAYDMKPRQFQVLAFLHDGGPTGQSELGHTMGIDPSILVTLLNPLEADGFVSRRRDPADRRRHVVTLTDTGKRHLEAAERAQREAEDELFAGLDADQREQLRELLMLVGHSGCAGREGACAEEAETGGC
jgi:DNA-binding MarR family transcriptional regulator